MSQKARTTGTTTSSSPFSSADGGELRRNALGAVNLLAQSVAALGPAASAAVLVGLVAALSGNGSWLTWLLATLFAGLAAFCFSALARRYSTSGGLASLVSKVGGAIPGTVVTLVILVFGIGFAPFFAVVFGNYARDYIVLLGYQGPTWWLVPAFGILSILFCAFLCLRDVALSTRVMLVIEIGSMAAILVLMGITLANHPDRILDTEQLTLSGAGLYEVVFGLVLAMFMFITFESSITLGREARTAQSTVTRSLYGSVLISGLFLVLCSYVTTLGFAADGAALAESFNPLGDLAAMEGATWLSYVIQLGIVAGMLAGMVAFLTWMSRVVLSLSKERILPAALGGVDRRHGTPRRAIFGIMVFQLVVFIVLCFTGGVQDLSLYGLVGSVFTLIYLFAYVVALLTIAVVAARRWHQPGITVAAVVAAGAFGYVIYNSVVPLPAFPTGVFTLVALGLMVLFVVVALLGSRKGGLLSRLGSSSVEL
ncbi:APC family permease [Herbiconiux sp. CPCC 203407]|uniref:APC family permease n=1 Tax=Herbiconiux oxytropis TaxID=2970915 RepID=A0AA41XIG0_9MICO|nr:APC family permease [Herbiconiux oxytropis]MCS5722543.1 APC family permease [Herbiconiux oxytropis]MCS5726483.1 APC family permease [Herbiconiux oxytropis]